MRRLFVPTFIIVEISIYLIYLYLDINHTSSAFSGLLKFIAICFCYFMVSDENKTIKLAMFLTVFSDFFLVITSYYEIGVISFIFVQMQYYKCITKKAHFPLDHLVLVFIAGFIVSIYINFFIYPISLIVLFASTYFITLLTNIAFSLSRIKDSKENIILTLCLLLIMFCDIHVGITNVFSSGQWYNFGLVAMWLFYLPSQVTIALLYSTKTQNRLYLQQTR